MVTVPLLLMQSTRARWNSIESIMTFGWSGSAVLGGFLIDRTGFRVTFLITAGMQTLSLIFLVALLPVVSSWAHDMMSKYMFGHHTMGYVLYHTYVCIIPRYGDVQTDQTAHQRRELHHEAHIMSSCHAKACCCKKDQKAIGQQTS